MRILVDTSVDSGFGVSGSAESLWAERWLARAGPIPISAATVFERCHGFSRRIEALSSPGHWITRLSCYRELVAEGAIYEVLPWDATGALVAGELLGRQPFPPSRRRLARGERRTDARRSWLIDVLIASQAAAEDRAVLTRNIADFRAIASLLPPPLELRVLAFPDDAAATLA